jgi:hypothetical protein
MSDTWHDDVASELTATATTGVVGGLGGKKYGSTPNKLLFTRY